MGPARKPIAERVASKIKIEPETGCHIWTGTMAKSTGYGVLSIGAKGQMGAHVAAWTVANGPVPPGLELDHLCRNRRCVNPGHLEAVTHGENMRRSMSFAGENARKTHCINGHPLSEDNLLRCEKNKRVCVICARERCRKYHERNRDVLLQKMAKRRQERLHGVRAHEKRMAAQ